MKEVSSLSSYMLYTRIIKNRKTIFIGTIGLSVLIIIGVISFLRTSSLEEQLIIYKHNDEVRSSDLSGNSTVLTSNVRSYEGQALDGKILYTTGAESSSSRGGANKIKGSELTVLDLQTDERRVIAEDIWKARFSPSGDKIVAVTSDATVHLYAKDGTEMAQIGTHGSNPIFSHNGKYIVYQKLADKGEDYFELAKNAQGIALYDIASGEERMLTKHSGDDWPIGFSADMRYFYFHAGRPYESSIFGPDITNIESGLYSLDMDTGEVMRLTNTNEKITVEEGATISFINNDALWTSDRLKAISGLGPRGTYLFIFDGKGGLKEVKKVSEGHSPRWIVQDESFAVRTISGGKEAWSIIKLKE